LNKPFIPTAHQQQNNPDNFPIKDQQIIAKRIQQLSEIYNDWHTDSNCTCCTQREPNEHLRKEYNTTKGFYWDWLSIDDIGKKCFYYKDDPLQSYPNIRDFFEELEQHYEMIRGELMELLKENQGEFQAWPETICKTKGRWKVYPLGFAFGRNLTHEPTQCPKTVELLARLNEKYRVDITTAGYSCLYSNCYISPHKGYCGYSNHCLRVHMGLVVPKTNHHACAIRVGNVRHNWVEGQVFAFDDYITHEAYNFTDQDRYILLLDIRFLESEKFKFYSKPKSIESNVNVLSTSTNMWKGIGSSSSGSGDKTEQPSFVALKQFRTDDIDCVSANYSDELKNMLKTVVDEKQKN